MLRKTLIWTLFFVTALFAGDRLLGWICGQLTTHSHFRYAKMYEGGMDAEVLIVGNSRGVNGFYVPEMEKALGKKVFNISFNGLRMDIARSLIEDYVTLNKTPETIVLEASVLTKAYPELLKEYKPFARPNNSLGKELKALYPTITKACQVSHLYRYNSELFLRSLYYLNRDDQTWVNKGHISSEQLSSVEKRGGTTLDYLPSLIDDLNAVQALCKEKGIRLRLILSPYLPQYARKMTNLDQWLAEINSRLSGNQIINYAEAVPGVENYADWVHLNKKGSEAFLAILMRDHIL